MKIHMLALMLCMSLLLLGCIPSVPPSTPVATASDVLIAFTNTVPVPSTTQYGFIKYPYLNADAGNFQLERGATITLTWDGAPPGAERYEFILYPLDGSPLILIGTDTNDADGVFMLWAVPDNLAAELKGSAHFSNGEQAQAGPSGFVYSDADAATQFGRISYPYLHADAGNFQLERGAAITLTWDGAPPGAERYEFILYPLDGSPLILIGTDTNDADGVFMLWAVPDNLAAELKGSAHFSNGEQAQAGPSGFVYSDAATQFGRIRYPYLHADAGNFQLEAGATITLNWEEAPAGAGLYEFILYPLDGSAPVLIATDNNASDGVTFSWTVPRGIAADLKGVALYPDGRTAESYPSGTVYSAP